MVGALFGQLPLGFAVPTTFQSTAYHGSPPKWNMETSLYEQVSLLLPWINEASFLAHYRLFACFPMCRKAVRKNWATGKVTQELTLSAKTAVSALCYDPQEGAAYTASKSAKQATFHRFDLRKGTTGEEILPHCKALPPTFSSQVDVTDVVQLMSVSPYVNRMITASIKVLDVWRVGAESVQHQVSLQEHSDRISCFQMQENFAVTGGWDRKLCLWDLAAERCLHVIQGAHAAFIKDLQFDETVLVSSGNDKSIRIFDRRTAAKVRDVSLAANVGANASVSAFRFSAAINKIAMGRRDGFIQVCPWDVLSGGHVPTYTHFHPATEASVSETYRGSEKYLVNQVLMDEDKIITTHSSTLSVWGLDGEKLCAFEAGGQAACDDVLLLCGSSPVQCRSFL
ncbi:F-box/WD repeat-containing protein 9, variant 2 [Balamuthia mandrillaris]